MFDSWKGERAVAYRRLNRIPDSWGTAVNVQQMVFGNKGESSCSGVAFSRDEMTGAPEPSGDFLVNAQGEDVVSGVRTPHDLREMRQSMPEAHAELMEILRELERHYGDMQDTEFTVEEGRLYMLQTRSAKRPAQAAVRFAVDAVEEGLLTSDEALRTIDSQRAGGAAAPDLRPRRRLRGAVRGVAASPGAAKGEIVFTAADAVAAAEEGREVVLVRPVHRGRRRRGLRRRARASSPARAARPATRRWWRGGWASRACPGPRTSKSTCAREGLRVDGTELARGGLDRHRRELRGRDHRRRAAGGPRDGRRLRDRAGLGRRAAPLGVRANADTPEEAAKARELGAEGIGLCRTEHMFMGADRQLLMRAMIMAETTRSAKEALDKLLPLQQDDFEGLFEAMAGLPVSIRLLDPPLHEFLPHAEELEGAERERVEESDELEELEHTLDRVHTLGETNPMLGTRGCGCASSTPRSRDAGARDRARRAAVRERPGARRVSRSWCRWSPTSRSSS